MRNLKRVLSLAMASVMLVGMMVVGAGAASLDDFSDKDKIVNTDAVTMVSELGIIQGMPDGSYQPEANIDRASMAKMICVALNGGKDPSLSEKVTTSYTDTVGNWAAGYIEYCTSMGIVAGKGDKTFQPSANVTVSEGAKMLLVALGYNAETEGLVGANWQTKTDVLANQVKLYDGFIALTSEPLSRDNAAQMIYNALNASVVKYDGGKAVAQTTSSYEWIQDPNNPGNSTAVTKEVEKSLLNDRYKVVETSGVVTANEHAALAGGVAKEGVSVIGGRAYNLATSLDMLGQKVTIYAKDTKTNGNYNVVGGAVPTNDNKLVVVSSGKTAAKLTDLLKDDSLKVDSNTKYSVNYANTTSTAITKNEAGQELRIIDFDNDGIVDYMIQTSFNLGKVTKYATTGNGSISVRMASGTLTKDKSEDVIGFDDVKKDDYVLAVEIGGKLYVEKPETVTGKVNRVKAGETITVDGDAYDVSGLAAYLDGGDLELAKSYTDTGVTATFYIDKFGYVLAVGDAEEAVSNYALVLGFEANGKISNGRAKVVLSDGTTATYTLNKVEKWDTSTSKWVEQDATDVPTDSGLVVGQVVAYSLNSSDEITLRIADSNKLGKDLTTNAYTGTDGRYIFTKGKTSVQVGKAPTDASAKTYYANSNTVFFYMNTAGDKADVYVGNGSAPTVDFDGTSAKATTYSAILDGTTLKAIVVKGVKAATAGDYLYLVNFLGNDSDASYFDAIIDGEYVKNITVGDNSKDDGDYGIYEYTKNADNEYDLSTATGSAYVTGLVTKVSGNSIFVKVGAADPVEYVLKNDSVVALIDGDKSSVEGEAVEKNDYVVLVQDDGDIKAIFIATPYDEDDFALTVTSAGVTANTTVSGTVIHLAAAVSGTDLLTHVQAPTGYTASCTQSTNNVVAGTDTVTVTCTATGATLEYSIEIG